MNYKKIYAYKAKTEAAIKNLCPKISSQSGIYVFFRVDENGIKYCYVGQAKKLLERAAAHLREYDHIALSLKKRGFYDFSKNPYGWHLSFKECSISELDEKERETIISCAKKGYQLYNVTIGGQGEGKTSFDHKTKSNKGYYDGLKQGYENARREIKHLFDLHLNFSAKKQPPTKLQEKAMQKFKDFLEKNE